MDTTFNFSPTQRQRLAELGHPESGLGERFSSAAERDAHFESLGREATRLNLDRLEALRTLNRRPEVRLVETVLVDTLVSEGFVEVVTPVIIGKGSLAKMGLDEAHPLWRQLYWVDEDRCLRPMLAPNLYVMLSHLQRLWPAPVRIFEVGPCFRKESKGSNHLSEFTMLNLVELGPGHATPAGVAPEDAASEKAALEKPALEEAAPAEAAPAQAASERLHELAGLVMGRLGLAYNLVETASEVYGASLDIEVGGVEVASGVAGPHPLDGVWGIHAPWAGWGFGLERLAMVRTGFGRVHPVGRSLVYLDGARLNVQALRPVGRGLESGSEDPA